MVTNRQWLLCLTLTVSAACGGCALDRGVETSAPDPPDRRAPPPPRAGGVDLLFVVGSSAAMGEAQTKLARGFGELLEALRSDSLGPDGTTRRCDELQPSGCRMPGLHVGVVSADLAEGGRLQTVPRVAGCTPPSKPFVSYAFDGTRGVTNIAGGAQEPVAAVREAFACIAQLGTRGAAGQPLEAARQALDPKMNINPGLVRADAVLAVVFVTDADDRSACEAGVAGCSPAADGQWEVGTRYVDFFRALKPPGRLVVAAVSDASSATLIEGLVAAFAPHSQLTGIGELSFAPALRRLGRTILGALGQRCITSPLLTLAGGVACRSGDEYAPGKRCAADPGCLHEVACDVIEIVGQGTLYEKSSSIPRCPRASWYPADWRSERDCGAECPCWRIVRKDPSDCDPAIDGTPYDLDVLAPAGAPRGVVEARCLTSPMRWGSQALGEVTPCQPPPEPDGR